MGGIKHGKWYANPAEPRASIPTDWNDAQAVANWAQQDAQARCKICGYDILLQPSGEQGFTSTGFGNLQNPAAEQWAEEREAGMHKQCFINYMRAQQMKANGNQS